MSQENVEANDRESGTRTPLIAGVLISFGLSALGWLLVGVALLRRHRLPPQPGGFEGLPPVEVGRHTLDLPR
jgi:hypothetical protein